MVDVSIDLNKIVVGYKASVTVQVTDKMVRQFAELSGDHNPIHLDEEYAATTIFKKRIAHGMILGAIVSRVLIETIGTGGIYRGQTLKFYNPVYIDENITFNIEITKVHQGRGLAVVSTTAVKSNGDFCMKGEATIIMASGVASKEA